MIYTTCHSKEKIFNLDRWYCSSFHNSWRIRKSFAHSSRPHLQQHTHRSLMHNSLRQNVNTVSKQICYHKSLTPMSPQNSRFFWVQNRSATNHLGNRCLSDRGRTFGQHALDIWTTHHFGDTPLGYGFFACTNTTIQKTALVINLNNPVWGYTVYGMVLLSVALFICDDSHTTQSIHITFPWLLTKFRGFSLSLASSAACEFPGQSKLH